MKSWAMMRQCRGYVGKSGSVFLKFSIDFLIHGFLGFSRISLALPWPAMSFLWFSIEFAVVFLRFSMDFQWFSMVFS